MAKSKTLAGAFYETLKDVHSPQRRAVKALKTPTNAAEPDELKYAETEAEEGAHQVERLRQVFELIGKPARSQTREAMQGITAEMAENSGIQRYAGGRCGADRPRASGRALRDRPLRDAQDLGPQLRFQEAAGLLEEALPEEKRADEPLTQSARKGSRRKS